MAKAHKTLVNKTKSRIAINFLGAFPNNKWANTDGKIYLSEEEWDWVQTNIPHWLEKGKLVEAGSENDKPVKSTSDEEKEMQEFFEKHTNSAKSVISKMTDVEQIDKLIEYGNDNDVHNKKIVDLLAKRYNELSE